VRKACWPYLLVLLCVACNSDSSNPPPADVAGTWFMTATNADSATFTNCSGDFALFQGDTVADTLPPILTSSAGGLAPVVTQNGTMWSMMPQTIFGVENIASGDVNGNSISGRFDGVDSASTLTLFFNGVVTGDSMAINVHTGRLTGAVVGECSIDPPLAVDVFLQ